MNKLTRREKRTLVIGVSFMVLFSLIWFIIIPCWQEYQNVTGELTELKKDYTHTRDVVMKGVNYKSRLTAYAEAYQELASHYFVNLGENEATLAFLALIEELAGESGVNIVSKTPQTPVEEENYQRIRVNLNLRATPKELTDLLLAFRQSAKAIDIDELRIDVDQRNRLLQLKLNLSTLLLREESEELE